MGRGGAVAGEEEGAAAGGHTHVVATPPLRERAAVAADDVRKVCKGRASACRQSYQRSRHPELKGGTTAADPTVHPSPPKKAPPHTLRNISPEYTYSMASWVVSLEADA